MDFNRLKRYENLWVLLGYLVSSFFLTIPFLANTNGSVFGDGDVWQVLWNFWWTKTAIISDSGVFYTQFLHWPNGISLVFHTLSFSSSIPSTLLQNFFSLTTTLHIIIYAHFVLTGFAMYLLAKHVTRSSMASFFAGYLFTFSAYHIMRSQGHINLFAMEGIPLYIYFLFKIHETKSWRYVFFAGLALAYTGYADLYYLFYLFIISIIFFFYIIFTNKKEVRIFFVRTLVMGLFGIMILLPLLFPLFYEKIATTNHDVYGHDPLVYSNDLESFFVPGAYSLYAQETSPVWDKWTGYWETSSYIGFSVILLVIFTFFTQRKNPHVWMWAILALVFFVLSLGPYLHIGGVAYRSIPLPYIVMMKIPFISMGGVVMRFASIGNMALIILTAIAIATIQKKQGRILAILVGVIVIAELFPAPVGVSALNIPQFYSVMASDSEDYAIMDFSHDPQKVLYYQTIHGKPIIGGYTSRPTKSTQEFLKSTPVISDLYDEGYRYQIVSPPKNGRQTLESLNIKYVLIPSYHRQLRKYLDDMELNLIQKNTEMMVYQVY